MWLFILNQLYICFNQSASKAILTRCDIKQNQFEKAGVNPFNAPVPGESLTASPATKQPWETPPQYTEQDKAMEAVYMELTSPDNLEKLVDIINEGTPLDEIAQVVLYKGYSEGLFSPDLMMLLIEPTLYLLIAIADYADIKDYVLYDGEDTDPEAEIHGDDVEPVEWDEEEEVEIKEPKKESLGESLLAKVESELPAKVAEIKERE